MLDIQIDENTEVKVYEEPDMTVEVEPVVEPVIQTQKKLEEIIQEAIQKQP